MDLFSLVLIMNLVNLPSYKYLNVTDILGMRVQMKVGC